MNFQQNNLKSATSPYLKQHENNPVWWQSWNDEVLNHAKEVNKPLLISIGYSACHWCHVMEHQSFEDDEVAKVMNENFVCIKVDREGLEAHQKRVQNGFRLLGKYWAGLWS